MGIHFEDLNMRISCFILACLSLLILAYSIIVSVISTYVICNIDVVYVISIFTIIYWVATLFILRMMICSDDTVVATPTPGQTELQTFNDETNVEVLSSPSNNSTFEEILTKTTNLTRQTDLPPSYEETMPPNYDDALKNCFEDDTKST